LLAKGGVEAMYVSSGDVHAVSTTVSSWLIGGGAELEIPVFWRLSARAFASGSYRVKPESLTFGPDTYAFDVSQLTLTIGLGVWVRL
jgi:hypothetical protein